MATQRRLRHTRSICNLQHQDHQLQHQCHSISRGKKTDNDFIKDVSPVELENGGSSSVTFGNTQTARTYTPKLQAPAPASPTKCSSRMSIVLSLVSNTQACPSQMWNSNDGGTCQMKAGVKLPSFRVAVCRATALEQYLRATTVCPWTSSKQDLKLSEKCYFSRAQSAYTLGNAERSSLEPKRP